MLTLKTVLKTIRFRQALDAFPRRDIDCLDSWSYSVFLGVCLSRASQMGEFDWI